MLITQRYKGIKTNALQVGNQERKGTDSELQLESRNVTEPVTQQRVSHQRTKAVTR